MQALASGDTQAFLAQEMQQRERGGWPPFTRLAALLFDGFDEAQVRSVAQGFVRCAPRYEGVHYLGPAPAPVARARNRYRYQMLVKAPRRANLQAILRDWLKQAPLPRAVRLRIDIDPQRLM